MRLMNPIAAMLIVLMSACAARGPVLDTGDQPSNVGGTISGVVRASGDAPLSGRRVTAVNVATGARLETSTSVTGGYTLKVAAGHYRLEVELRPGEVVTSRPDDVHISTSDMDAGRNFVITVKP